MPDFVIRIVADPAPAAAGASSAVASIQRVEDKAKSANATLDVLAKALLARHVLHELEQWADGFTEIQNRLRTVTSSEEELQARTEDLFRVAQETRTSWEDTASTYQRVQQATRELYLTQGQVVDLTEQLNKAFIIAGVSAGEQARVTRDLLHGLDQGTLAWRQLLPIMAQAPSVARIIAQHFHVTTGELHHLATSGKITARAIVDAFAEASDQLDRDFGKTVPTISQTMTQLRNAMTKFIGEAFASGGALRPLADAAAFVANHFEAFGRALVTVAEIMIARWALDAIPKAIKALQALAATIMAHPILALAALALVIYNFRSEVGAAITAIGEWLMSFRPIAAVVHVVSSALGLLASIASGAAKVIGGLASIVGTLIGPFVAAGAAILDFAGSALSGLIDGLGSAIEFAGDLTSGLIDLVSSGVDSFFSSLTDGNSELAAFIRGEQEASKWSFDMVRNMGRLTNAIQDTTNAARAFEAVAIVQNTTKLVEALVLSELIHEQVGQAQITAAKGIGEFLRTTVKEAERAAQEAKRAAEEARREAERYRDALASLQAETDPAAAAAQQLAKAIETVTEAERRGWITTEQGTRLIQARTAAIAAQQIAADESHFGGSADADIAAMDLAIQKTADEFEAARKARAAFAREPLFQNTSLSQLQILQDELDKLAHTADRTLVGAIEHVADAFAQMVITGKFSFSALANAILADLQRLIARMITVKLLEAAIGLFGGGGSKGAIDYFASVASGTPVYGGSHALGGSFTAPGNGGPDSVPVLFRMTPGETAYFRRPTDGPPAAQVSAPPVHVTNQVIVDPGFVPSAMASPAGHRTMLEFVRLNSAQIRALLS